MKKKKKKKINSNKTCIISDAGVLLKIMFIIWLKVSLKSSVNNFHNN